MLAILIPTVASESAFSIHGRILDSFQSSLTPKMVEAFICSQDWIRAAPLPSVEESADDVEKLEACNSSSLFSFKIYIVIIFDY